MKQTLFMIVATLVGTLGVFVDGPFVALAVYYLFAVLRPQYLWLWALPQGIAWSQFVAIAAIIGAVGYAFGAAPFRPPEDPPFRGWSLSQKLYVAFGVWVVFSYFTAMNQQIAGIWVIEYLKIFLVFTIAVLVVRQPRQVWQLYLVATISLVYIAYEVNELYLVEGRLDIYHHGYGGLDNNGAGLMLAMAVPLSLYAFEAARAKWRWVFAAAVPVLVHAVLMTYSRGAMLSLVLATPFFLARSRRRGQFALITLMMAIALPFMAGREIRERFMTLNEYQRDESANSRFQSWEAAIQIANAHPLLGVGIRNSNLFSYKYGADMEGRTIHSQYLQILADSGYPALILYVGGTLTLIGGLMRARRRLKQREDEEAHLLRSMLNGIEGTLIIFVVGSAFLSLEVFELPYLMALLGGQLVMLSRQVEAPVVAEPVPAPALTPWPDHFRPRTAGSQA